MAEQRNVRRLLSTTGAAVQASITLDELAACQREVAQVALPDALFDLLLTLKARTEEQGFRASDRRWRQVVDVLKARAYLDGDDEVTEDHLDVLADVLWQQPKDRPALATLVGTVGNPLNVRANEVLDIEQSRATRRGRDWCPGEITHTRRRPVYESARARGLGSALASRGRIIRRGRRTLRSA